MSVRMKGSELQAEIDNQQFELTQRVEVERNSLNEYFDDLLGRIQEIRDIMITNVDDEY